MTSIAKWMLGIFCIVLLVIVAFSYGQSTQSKKSSIAETQSEADTTAASEVTCPTDWKVLTLTELDRQLCYPSDWQDFAFVKKTQKDYTNIEGTWWYATFAGETPAPDQISFAIKQKDFGSWPPSGYIFKSKIDPSWTQEQFESEINVGGKVLQYKQLSPNAVFVATYSNYECSPGLTLSVFAPFSEEYPNIDIQIPYDASAESAIRRFESEQEAKGEPACDQQEIYQTIVDGWAKNGLPASVEANLGIARQIADSIRPYNASPVVENSDWQTYIDEGGKFTIQYPRRLKGDTENWVVAKNPEAVGGALFGTPASATGGYIWGVFAGKQVADLEKKIAGEGDQWADRQESRTNVTIDGVPAILVTVTTASQPDWISKVVYVTKGDMLYTITNGAIPADEFTEYYESFKFTD